LPSPCLKARAASGVRLPERGDVVILTPEGKNQDYIKRVIGLPGDLFEMRSGQVYLNGKPIRQEAQPVKDLPVDANNPCTEIDFPGALVQEADGSLHCYVTIVRETLPNGVSYDTIDARRGSTDDVAPVRIPAGHYYLLGDNRDNSADSRVDAPIGLGGPVAWERIGGRAEIITFSLDGSTDAQSGQLVLLLPRRTGGHQPAPRKAEPGSCKA
jgi:signal peptidase I